MAATRNVLRPFFVIMNTGYYGDRYGAVRNDTFQLGGSAFGGLGGVQNGWERFMAVKGRIEFMSLQRRATRGPPS